MAYSKLVMTNPHTGRAKEAPVGFSWTSLFFTFLVPLIRGHYLSAFLWFLATTISMGLSAPIQAFIYNRQYVQFLINEGYKVSHSYASIELISNDLKMILPVLETTENV